MPSYTLIGPDGVAYATSTPGALGGHRRNRVFGRLDCPGALRWIERGHYVRQRVFFADEGTAWAAGYRPCHTCLPGPYAEWKRGRAAVRLTPAAPFDARGVRDFLAARAVTGVERVEGDVLHRRLGTSEIELEFGESHVDVRVHAAAREDLNEAVRRARRVIDADADPAGIVALLGGDPLLGPLVRARPGLRAPGAFDDYEIGARAIVGQAISVAATRTILGRLPERAAVAAARPEDLPMPRVRARALIEHAQGRPLEEIKGVGPWTLGYVALRTGDPDVLLATDLVVRKALARLGGPETPRAIAQLGERWRPLRSYATHHLWAA